MKIGKILQVLSAVSAIAALSNQAVAADLRIVPSDGIVLNPTNPGKGYFDAVVHAIAVAAGPDESLMLQSLEVTFQRAGVDLLTKSVPVQGIVAETGEIGQMAGAGLEALVNAQVLNGEGLMGLFARDISFATSLKLSADQALLTTRHHFSLDSAADRVVVTAEFLGEDGTTSRVQKGVPVQPHKSKIAYTSPLDGVWLKTASVSIEGHHRLNPGTEFAIDFFKLDEFGNIHNGNIALAENYFGFDVPVMAAADGQVVYVIDDAVQDRVRMRPLEGESLEEARRRISQLSFQKMATDFPRAVAGNIVVLRHEEEGQIEYSAYGHLASESVRVAMGQRVKRGDVIGKVGDTGDTIAVHLHFQVNAGPNPFNSKSLPVAFENLNEVNRGVDPLRFVSGE